MSIFRNRPFNVGDVVRVVALGQTFPLPEGLPNRVLVEILEQTNGSTAVLFQGRTFIVPTLCVNSGFQYLVNGQWVDNPP